MKILVTGHKGYLGKEFIKKYGDGYKIVGFDIADGDDLLDFEKLKHVMKDCEQVVHIAAIPRPVEGKSFNDYFDNNVRATLNVVNAAVENGVKRIVYASSTTIYGIEKGIPFQYPIKEDQAFLSQYTKADDLKCRDVDLSYHMSKVMAEQVLAWHGLNKQIQAVALRFGPIEKVFLGTSVSMNNATQALRLSIESEEVMWYEAFSIVDEIAHIDISKAKHILKYQPETPNYTNDQIDSSINERQS